MNADESQATDEVFRRLEHFVDDVIAFSKVFQAIYYGHLEVEATLEEINQILSTLTDAQPEGEASLNQPELALVPVVNFQSDAGNSVFLSPHEPNYVIVNTSKPHPFSTHETSYFHDPRTTKPQKRKY